jgi:hypothetical protein
MSRASGSWFPLSGVLRRVAGDDEDEDDPQDLS